MELPGYIPLSLFHHTNSAYFYRSTRILYDKPVLIKTPTIDNSNQDVHTSYHKEYRMGRNSQYAWASKVVAFEVYEGCPFIVYQYLGGDFLGQIIYNIHFNLLDLLNIAYHLATTLCKVHEAEVIHKRIHPHNILWSGNAYRVFILDNSLCTYFGSETETRPNTLKSSYLHYISPEQSGRLNRHLDWRTDIYSLGVSFYELFSRQVPLDGDDPLELLYAHIASEPVPLSEANPEIPKGLSDLVMKMLHKEPERRYQSAEGIQTDLEHCIEMMKEKNTIPEFDLAGHDVPIHFSLPQKVYGRKPEIDRLFAGLDEVCLGRKEMVLITGTAGVGKTRLAKEILQARRMLKGYFVTGKFDQYSGNLPYSGWTQALSELVQSILTESQERYNKRKILIEESLGNIGKAVVDFIPELEWIIGPQPNLPKLGLMETQNRLIYVFQEFIHALCKPGYPLVIFLDDSHWADAASLNLIRFIMTDERIRFLYLILAYRDNEVHPSHPLIRTINELHKAEIPIREISLDNLSNEDLSQWFSDATNQAKESLVQVSEQIGKKTLGNPYFVQEYMKSLYSGGHLEFDLASRTWRLDVGKPAGPSASENVVDLLIAEIVDYDHELQGLIKFGAVLGNRFDLRTLSNVCGETHRRVFERLERPVMDGILYIVGDGEGMPSISEADQADEEANSHLGSARVEYVFAHDRVQQAAYSLIPEAERSLFHRRVGERLLGKFEGTVREENLIRIVEQLNKGIGTFEQESEKIELAALNLAAGMQARTSGAWAQALENFSKGLQLLPPDSWQSNYYLALSLHNGAAEASHISGDQETVESLTNTIFEKALSLEDKVSAYEIIVKSYFSQGRIWEGLEKGFPVLAMFRINSTKKPSQLKLMVSYLWTKFSLNRTNIDKLMNAQPTNKNPKALAIEGTISVATSAHFVLPELLALVVFKVIRLSLRYGGTEDLPAVFSGLGLILCGAIGDIERGNQIGALGIELAEKLDIINKDPRPVHIFGSTINHWKHHQRSDLPLLDKALKVSLENGDYQFAGLASHITCVTALFSGLPLNEVEETALEHIHLAKRINETSASKVVKWIYDVARRLQAKPADSTNEDNLETNIANLEALHDNYTLSGYYFVKQMTDLILCDFDDAFTTTDMAKSYLRFSLGTVYIPNFHFYDSLIKIKQMEQQKAAPRERIKIINSNQKKMNKWAFLAPMNYQHKFDLVAAELKRIQGREFESRQYYENAINGAKEHGFLHEAALASELAALSRFRNEDMEGARSHMMEAVDLYRKWGAETKVEALKTNYPYLYRPDNASISKASAAVTLFPQQAEISSENIDLVSVIKASQAISGEMGKERLLKQLVRIAMENAGAQKCYFIAEFRGKLMVEAEEHAGKGVTVGRGEITDGDMALSSSIVNYVARTKDYLVLDDVSNDQRFLNDPYISENNPKSVLCAPLISRGKLQAILYMENNLVTNAFTQDRLSFLNVVGAQAAISLENARLYELERKKKSQLRAAIHKLKEEVSTRKAREADLMESEDRFRKLSQASFEGMAIFDDTCLLDANEQFFEMFGYTPEEILMKPDSMNMLAEVCPEIKEHLLSPDEGEPEQTEALTKDGSPFFLEVRKRRVSYQDHGATVVVFRDITLNKKAEKTGVEGVRGTAAHAVGESPRGPGSGTKKAFHGTAR